MTLLQVIIIILFITYSLCQIQIPLLKGKSQVYIIDEVRRCPNEGSKAIVWDIKMNRLSRQQVVLQGNISMSVPLDDNVAGSIEVSEKGNMGWVDKGFVFKLPHLCKDLMLVLRSGWIKFWKKAGMSPPIVCPIPKGKYNVRDFPTSDIFKDYPGLREGIFKTNVVFVSNKNNNRLGCVEFIVHT